MKRSTMFDFSIITSVMMLQCCYFTDGVQVGIVVPEHQMHSVYQLLLQISPWLPEGTQLTLHKADNANDNNTCQNQANSLHEAGKKYLIDMCCGKFAAPLDARILRADYLCPAQLSPATRHQVFASVLLYLRAILVDRVAVIGRIPPALTDVLSGRQFAHLRVGEWDTLAEINNSVDINSNRKIALFLQNKEQLSNALNTIKYFDKFVLFVEDTDVVKLGHELHALKQSNVTLITTRIECSDHLSKDLAQNRPGYVTEKLVHHLQAILNNDQTEEDNTECSIRILRWLPRNSVDGSKVHALRSSDWITEGTMESENGESLHPQPFHAIKRSRLESLLGGCGKWLLNVRVQHAGERNEVTYHEDSMPEILSVHGPGTWHFLFGCVGGKYTEYVCTIGGRERCEMFSSDHLLQSVDNRKNTTHRQRRDIDNGYGRDYEQTDNQNDYNAHWNQPAANPNQYNVFYPDGNYREPFPVLWGPRRRYAAHRANTDQQLLSAITPDTFGCGGVITGCALCVALLSTIASVVSPLGCIGPCSIAGISTCAKLAGVIYRETVVDGRLRRLERRLSRPNNFARWKY